MADEQVNAGGVQTPAANAGNGTAAAPQPGTQPTNTTPPQGGAQTQTEDFRKWQAERDRERARLQAEAETARRDAQKARDEAAQSARRAQEAALAGADPEEKAKFYQTQFEQAERQRQAERAQTEQQQRLSAKAMAALQRAGIEPMDERLTPYLTGDSWEERMANLAEGIAAINQGEIEKMRAEIAKAEKRGALQALNESGVTQTSDAQGTGNAADAKERKAQDYRDRLKKLKRSGNMAAVVQLQTQAEREGISL